MERNNPAVLDFLRQMTCKPQTAPQQLLTRLATHEARAEGIVTKQSNCALGGTPPARENRSPTEQLAMQYKSQQVTTRAASTQINIEVNKTHRQRTNGMG
jgi:hypothetical protein